MLHRSDSLSTAIGKTTLFPAADTPKGISMAVENSTPESAAERPGTPAVRRPAFEPVEEADLDAHFAEIYAHFGIGLKPSQRDAEPDAAPEEALYRWRYFAPGFEEDGYPEEPLFLVMEDSEEPEEYSGFQAFAYDDFGLVDVMAFSSEPGPGQTAERVLELLRADSRMIEDPSIEL